MQYNDDIRYETVSSTSKTVLVDRLDFMKFLTATKLQRSYKCQSCFGTFVQKI